MAEILRMPEVAAGADEAVLSSWVAALGSAFRAGDVVMTIETEKAVVDVEAEADGVLLRTLVEEGATVAVGAPIAVYGADGESADDAEALLSALGAPSSSAGAHTSEQSVSPVDGSVAVRAEEAGPTSVATEPRGGERLFASPLARRLARDAGLALADIRGTGPRGRIRRRDVEAAVKARSAPVPAEQRPTEGPATSGHRGPMLASEVSEDLDRGHEDIPNSRLRRAVARRLTESKQTTPHFYLRGAARVDRLLALRQEVNGSGHRVSVNDLVVRAVARAHRVVPAMNVEWRDDVIRRFRHVDVAVAVAIDDGLVTPVVRDADQLGIARLSSVTRDLAGRARERRLQQSELEGGSISVTNLGMYGVGDFAAIINPPQAAILAVGAAREEAVVSAGQVAAATLMRLCLAVDHRPVDGATAAQWLRALVELLENPVELLV